MNQTIHATDPITFIGLLASYTARGFVVTGVKIRVRWYRITTDYYATAEPPAPSLAINFGPVEEQVVKG